MKFENIKPNETYFNTITSRMGNTTLRTTHLYRIHVVSVDEEKRTVQASWNGNCVQTFYKHQYSKWREKEPMMVRNSIGQSRLATKAERDAAKAIQ